MLQFFEALELVWDLVLQECGLRFPVLAKEENNDSEQESVYYAFETCGLLGFCGAVYCIGYGEERCVACLSLLIYV